MTAQTLTLADFLLARIAEDEAMARSAVIPKHDGPDAYKPHPELRAWQYAPWTPYHLGDQSGEVEYVRTPEMLTHKYDERIYVTCDSEGLSPSVAEDVGPHIARHDPARVLAECEAKRGLLTFVLEHGASIDGEFGCCHDAESLRAGGRGPDFEGDEFEPLPEDCDGVKAALPGLLLLALPYADHADYSPAWRP